MSHPSFEIKRIPYTIRLKQLNINQQLGLWFTDSDEVIFAQQQVYKAFQPFAPVVAPVPIPGVKPRNLYVQYDSPIFMLAQAITNYYTCLNKEVDGSLFCKLMSPNTDSMILDHMIDQFEIHCRRSLGYQFTPISSASSAFEHIMLTQFNACILPCMFSRDLLKAALVGLLRGGDVIEQVEHNIHATPFFRRTTPEITKTSCCSMVEINDRQLELYKRNFRRQKTYLNGTRCEYAFVSIFRNIVSDPWKYPMDIKIIRIVSTPVQRLPVTLDTDCNTTTPLPMNNDESTVATKSSRPKRSKVQNSTGSVHTSNRKSSQKNTKGIMDSSKEVIAIDSDDEISVQDKPKTVIHIDDMHISPLLQTTKSTDYHPPYYIFPDPVPKFVPSAFVFVRSLQQPGYILSSRVVRETDTVMTLLQPYISYIVYMKFAIAFITEADLQPMDETCSKTVTFDGVVVTTVDQLRLWPSIYLNDSLINFYLKWVQKQHSSNDIFIFPTYFYSRVSYLEEGGLVYKDTKEERGKLWNDLKGWTKGVDIFSKSFILFPINSNKHWSFVLICNLGHFLRIPLSKFAKRRKQVEVVNVNDDNSKILTASDESVLMSLNHQKIVINDKESECGAVGDQTTEKLSKENSSKENEVSCVDIDVTENSVSEENLIDLSNAVDVDMSMDSEEDMTSFELAPYIIHFDSGKRFKSHVASTLFKNLRKYTQACYEATKVEEFPGRVVDGTSIPGLTPDLPQQSNAEDCGVYMLEFIERLLINPSSVNGQSITDMGKRNGKAPPNFWFTNTVPTRKRETMYALLNSLSKR